MPDSGTMPSSDSQEPADLLQLALPRSQKVVLVIDLVESVRLMSADEAGTVARWHSFVQQARDHTIPQHHGRLVKSLGDGLMVEFEQARDAVNAAQTLHSAITHTNAGLATERHMHLRAGINSSQIYTDQLDIYGAGVNLAARLATLAGPGETVVSASVRDGLTDGLDASVEDLGECYLKHIDEPVRAYRAGVAGAAPVVVAQRAYAAPLQPTIAVIPFEARSNEPEHFAIGELIADAVIGQMAKTRELRVISRLSTTVFRGRRESADDIRKHLGADYILSGSYLALEKNIVITAELTDSTIQKIIWTDRIAGQIADLVSERSEITNRIANATHMALLGCEVQRAQLQPLNTLQSHSLLLGAVSMMHRTAKVDFFRAKDLLLHLQERHQRQALISAWLAKWYVLQVEQGWTDDARVAAARALDSSKKALDLDPDSPLALSMDGFVRCNLMKDFDIALQRYELALQVNPSESIAWLLKGMLHAFRGEADPAIAAAGNATVLSPLDPTRYFYDSLSASIHLSAGNYGVSINHAQRSIRANSTHVSTYRALTIAQVMDGQVDSARQTAKQLLQLDPDLTVSRFLARSPGVKFGIGKTFAEALRVAGVPA